MAEKDEKEKKARRVGTWGFAIGECPIWLFNKFDKLAKAKFNDIYWVALVELYHKAEAYDNLMIMVMVEQLDEPEVKELEVKEEDKGISLLGGNKGVIKK